MPKVGDKEFAYTPEGIKQAKKESEATGTPVQDASSRKETYALGGQIPGEEGFGQNPEKYFFGGMIKGFKERAAEKGGGWLSKGMKASGRKPKNPWEAIKHFTERIANLRRTKEDGYTGRHVETPDVATPVETPDIASPLETPNVNLTEDSPVEPDVAAATPAPAVADDDYMSGREGFAEGGKVTPTSTNLEDKIETITDVQDEATADDYELKRGGKVKKARKQKREAIKETKAHKEDYLGASTMSKREAKKQATRVETDDSGTTRYFKDRTKKEIREGVKKARKAGRFKVKQARKQKRAERKAARKA